MCIVLKNNLETRKLHGRSHSRGSAGTRTQAKATCHSLYEITPVSGSDQAMAGENKKPSEQGLGSPLGNGGKAGRLVLHIASNPGPNSKSRERILPCFQL